MEKKIVQRIDGIETMGELRQAIKLMSDDVPISDVLGLPLKVTLLVDEVTGDPAVEVC